MSSQVRMHYHGSPRWGAAGAAHGFVLKTIPIAGASSGNTLPDAYIVTAFPGPDGVVVRVGVAEELNAGTEGYEFRSESEGHSQHGDYLLFPEPFSQDGEDHDLGYWQLAASLTSDAGNVHIAGTLTSADGEERSFTWTDTGSSAVTGEGHYGLVGAGLWSLENQFDDLLITNVGSGGAGDCGGPTQPSSYSIDFEQSDSEDQFIARDGGTAARRTRGNGGRVLNIRAFNTSQPFLFVPDQSDAPLTAEDVSMSADVAMAYYGSSVYGPRGSASGFLLKSLPADGSDAGAYMVSVAPTPKGLTMRIGATRNAEAGTADYHFLDESDGHSSAIEQKLFGRRFKSDNRNHGLGFWHLDAELTTNGDQVTITAKLSTPRGRTKSMTWTDSGPSAYTGSGTVGLVNEGFWSIPNRYDNLEVNVSN